MSSCSRIVKFLLLLINFLFWVWPLFKCNVCIVYLVSYPIKCVHIHIIYIHIYLTVSCGSWGRSKRMHFRKCTRTREFTYTHSKHMKHMKTNISQTSHEQNAIGAPKPLLMHMLFCYVLRGMRCKQPSVALNEFTGVSLAIWRCNNLVKTGKSLVICAHSS